MKCVGTIKGENGRPALVYCKWRPRSLEHDVKLTQFFVAFHCEFPLMNVIRGNNLECEADAIMWIGQQKFYVEFDTGEMSYQRVQNRWKSYEEADGILLVVTSTETRLRGMQKVSGSVAAFSMFSTLEAITRSPFGDTWQDIDGESCGIEKPC